MFAKMHYQIFANADDEDGIMALCRQQHHKNTIKSIQFKIEIVPHKRQMRTVK